MEKQTDPRTRTEFASRLLGRPVMNTEGHFENPMDFSFLIIDKIQYCSADPNTCLRFLAGLCYIQHCTINGVRCPNAQAVTSDQTVVK